MNPRLLVVDDEPDLRTLYELTLLREGYDVESAGSVEEAWALLTQRGVGGYQLVITDMRLPDGTGLDLLRRLDESGHPEKAIVITAYGSPENAVEALKAGAYDYLTKPVDLRQFRAVVASALGRLPGAQAPAPGKRAPVAARAAAVPRTALERIVGASAAMQQVRSLVERVARSMAPVLVCGESGTGKELVARAIHDCSPRSGGPFVAVNCGAIPEALLEAEFFGYRKGAFTGAHEDREGFFQAAQGGTLFLDEIGDLPLQMQSKLLRVIQERAVRPLGAVAEAPVNVRIVSATHKDLGAEVQAGRFRQDLYYRLNVIRIWVPPLRERIADMPAICAAVLERIAADAGVSPTPVLAPDALQHLLRYAFPGNVRELENLLHRALALAAGNEIGRADLGLPEEVLQEAPPVEPEPAPSAPAGPARAGAPAPAALPADLAAYLDNVERDILERALERHRYNRTAAGASLGLSLRQMRYRMARLGVGAAEGPAERGEPA
ncbi:MAG: sigma-54-dependent Fis family transcriptional regulator [Betaproteobacteria bacterium]|jgi:two-component system response regulator PilR (NtrC family)|nr:sigma-54-dependent Fis family transcriptional regulator [Betaproteobacteria bacterium]MBK8866326.1 sigma-54-dependent Fis family transcriptional regulator [Betaproteobacteria bacterium]MBP6319877.1 sigma-54-dependent Fis family transcriptional regulator [Rubrivivax sp.]MBP6464530.1 sigma-54-dependent Fis family transcriptional regulator [Rubrivivax sp.]